MFDLHYDLLQILLIVECLAPGSTFRLSNV